MSTVSIIRKQVHGKTRLYPNNQEAEAITKLTGRKTLREKDIALVRKLGLTIEEETEVNHEAHGHHAVVKSVACFKKQIYEGMSLRRTYSISGKPLVSVTINKIQTNSFLLSDGTWVSFGELRIIDGSVCLVNVLRDGSIQIVGSYVL